MTSVNTSVSFGHPEIVPATKEEMPIVANLFELLRTISVSFILSRLDQTAGSGTRIFHSIGASRGVTHSSSRLMKSWLGLR